MKCLIDGDIVSYAAGFANVQRVYVTPDMEEFKYKKEAVAHCTEKGLDPSNIEKRTTPDEPQFAFANAKKIIRKCLEACDTEEYEIYLSGSESFRKDLDSTYKAHRKEDGKPPQHEEIMQYLIDHHGAIVSHSGMEADDFLGMAAGEDTVICSLDKDLDQIAGYHYNWRDDNKYFISSDEADLWFWMQMLIGDTADNVQGVYGIGPVKAYRLLSGVEPDRRRCVVGLEYAVFFDDPEEKFKTNAQLLYIAR